MIKREIDAHYYLTKIISNISKRLQLVIKQKDYLTKY